MTLAAADSFTRSTQQTDSRESGSPADVKSAKQLARLMRTANLSDWQSDRADIQLTPTSCIDIYPDLVVKGNPVQLLASDLDNVNKFIDSKAGSIATRHLAGKLSLRCRKLEMETSPHSRPIRYNLYLAAGFVVYKKNNQTLRAPILLIPITMSRLRGRGSAYAITYQEGKLFRVNPRVLDMCTTHIDAMTPPLSDGDDLREFLRSVKNKIHNEIDCKVSANTGIMSLQSDVLGEFSKEEIVNIELQRTRPGLEFTPLPSTPGAFDPQLAIRILRFVAPDQLATALRNFSGQTTDTHTPVMDAEPDLDQITLEKYYKCAGWLIDVGLGHWKLKNIAELPARVEKMTSSINALLSNTFYQKHFRDEYQTVDMLYRLNRNTDKILHAPPEMQYHAISQHADPDTRLLLQKAKIQASSLEGELQEFQRTFHMSAVPSSTALHKLIKTIARREEESQLTNPNYFRARKALNEILKHHNGVLTDNDLNRLDRLAKTLRFAELFKDDPYYQRSFGSLFKGTDTNWQRLDSVINYVRFLSQDLGSPVLVAQFADQWVAFERDFAVISKDLGTATSSAHKLCALIPMFINQSTKLEHAASVGEKFRSRVDVWQKYLHRNFADPELTPFQLLSNVDLGEHNHPTITLSQQEFDERIYRHIVGTGLSSETVTATSEWLLNVVVRLETDLPAVRRFLDREAGLFSKLS